jgi:hypothetical protein
MRSQRPEPVPSGRHRHKELIVVPQDTALARMIDHTLLEADATGAGG